MSKKPTIRSIVVASLAGLWVATAHADAPAAKTDASEPWEKFSVNIGAFFPNSDTGLRLGSSVGAEFDLEDTLGFDSSESVFRADAAWRFTSNRRHRFDISWFAIRRDAQTTIGHDLVMEGDNGNMITVPTGSNVTSKLNLDLFEYAYSYSFIQDQRVDIAGIAGLF